jgi:hypothetical protein
MNEIIIQNNNPLENIRQSTDVAGACKEIVTKTAISIQGKKYVPVEGWMSIATAHGCVASISKVEPVEGNINFVRGYKATAEIRRMTDNMLISTAEGFVGEDEPVWFGGESEVYDKQTKKKVKKILPKRPDFAIRAMAQTRALSRVCRSAFAHIVVLMDAGLSTTPAEEMSYDIEVKATESREETVKTEIKPEQKQPIKSGIEDTFSKFKTAISECLITLNLERFIKASQTFDRYVQTLPEDLFEEFDHYMTKAITQICEGIETGDYNVNELMRDDLIKLFPTWKNEISRVYNNKPKKEEERIF